MEMPKIKWTHTNQFLAANFVFLIVGIILGFFEHGLAGAGIMIPIQIILCILSILGFIPLLGVILYFAIGYFYVNPFLLGLISVSFSWAGGALLVLNGVVCVVLTLQSFTKIFTTYWKTPKW